MVMKRKRMLVKLLLAVAVLGVAFVLVVRFLVRDAAEGFVDFEALRRSPTGNDALACPDPGCDFRIDPVPLPAAALAAKVVGLATIEPRTTVVARDDAGFRFVLVQRSLVFDFPDTVNVAIRPLDADHAALAIYSRSNYGRSDLGVNKARVRRWLRLLGVPAGAQAGE
jgi:uncharacterized protein (DUF1499 family)